MTEPTHGLREEEKEGTSRKKKKKKKLTLHAAGVQCHPLMCVLGILKLITLMLDSYQNSTHVCPHGPWIGGSEHEQDKTLSSPRFQCHRHAQPGRQPDGQTAAHAVGRPAVNHRQGRRGENGRRGARNGGRAAVK